MLFSSATILIIYTFFATFARIGSAIMLLPGLGEAYMSPRARLAVALILTSFLTPITTDYFSSLPQHFLILLTLLGKEILVGFFIGAFIRITLSAIHTTGMIISLQSGLASANLFDPSQGAQSSVIGTFLTLLAMMLIFATNLHHLFIYGIIDSYQLFPPTEPLLTATIHQSITEVIAQSFLMGIKMASPQIVISLLLYLGAGVMGRLMPQMQVFFILLPVQILLALFILMITLSATMIWFSNHYQDMAATFMVIE